MTPLGHADVFFIVTTVVTIIVSLLFIVLLYYAIHLVRRLSKLAEKIEGEADEYIKASNKIRSGFFKHPLIRFLVGDYNGKQQTNSNKHNKKQ